MRQYHLKYQKIKKEAVEAVREAIKSGLFKNNKSNNYKILIIKTLHKNLCNIYRLKVIPVLYKPNIKTGYYSYFKNEIGIDKISLVTYLHEFAHYMKTKKGEKNSENIARGWSISLYYLADNKLCINAIKKGLIIHEKYNNIIGGKNHV